MSVIDVPPTKSNLRKIKAELDFAYEGFDLLEQKREILVIEIVKHINAIKDLEKKFKTALEELYRTYNSAAISMGSNILSLKGSSEKKSYSISIQTDKLMGILLPQILITSADIKKTSGFYGTTSEYDEAKIKCSAILGLIALYASETKSVFLLSRELKKVQRKVNALEKIFIPQHKNTKKFISERLEEMERDEIYIKKMIRKNME
ncbi:MAG: V-type ATP synthase subunit D [Spirochaetes bacterium]|nr:V-type ATP synthase subunit D [Spirochaetota bacterium]